MELISADEREAMRDANDFYNRRRDEGVGNIPEKK
jgi:1,2-phenylacetyl-CoA epoxidase PaaB subunit